ncbi:MAG TPA: 30S ribosome-binding factor RbfA [Acidimicrobiales bacterium]|nr:30S ribosome-binding factor RbfA [Acidimicrobiales bacterium]
MSARRHENRAATPYPRTARVNELLREVIAEQIERASDADDRLRMATVTGVQISHDLRHATVYLSSLSEETAHALSSRRAQFQSVISKQVRMKRTPTLAFVADPAIGHGRRVEEILRDLHERPHRDPDEHA